MKKSGSIIVKGHEITLYKVKEDDYLSLTDLASKFSESGNSLIVNWMRNKDTIEFLGVWEQLYNPDFNSIEFDRIKSESGLNRFILSVKRWINDTSAIGIRAKAGRYGGTYAHRDIALGFCYWLSPAFQLYLIKEFQRLKESEAKRLSLDWNVKRIIAKANYHIHTEAVREYLIPPPIAGTKKEGIVYANEADLLNIALFGMTSREWKQKNPDLKGNMRDHATTEQLLVLSNLESLNAKLIEWDSDAEQRLEILNKTAIEQMEILIRRNATGQLPDDGHLKLK